MNSWLVHLKGVWEEKVDFLPWLYAKNQKMFLPIWKWGSGPEKSGKRAERGNGGVRLGKGAGLGGGVSPVGSSDFCAVLVGLGGLSGCSFTSAVVIITSISDRLFCLVVGSAIALAAVPLLEICPLDTPKWRSCSTKRRLVTDPRISFPVVGPEILSTCHLANQRSMVRSVRDLCFKKEIQTQLTGELECFSPGPVAATSTVYYYARASLRLWWREAQGGLLRTSAPAPGKGPSPPSTTENKQRGIHHQ